MGYALFIIIEKKQVGETRVITENLSISLPMFLCRKIFLVYLLKPFYILFVLFNIMQTNFTGLNRYLNRK